MKKPYTGIGIICVALVFVCIFFILNNKIVEGHGGGGGGHGGGGRGGGGGAIAVNPLFLDEYDYYPFDYFYRYVYHPVYYYFT